MERLTLSLAQHRQQRQAALRWRSLRVAQVATRDAFNRNDYLGLAQHPQVIAAFQQGLSDYGCGSAGSPLICGYQAPHQRLTQQLAEWLERDSALLFSSGFAANQCALKGFHAYYDQFLLDRLCHASLLAGLPPRKWRRFPHQSVATARQWLGEGTNLIITESVFSMDGDQAPLAEFAALPADLWVDDAHGIGVIGKEGRGAAALLPDSHALLTIPFGKAIGVMGAALVGGTAELEYLVNEGREFIYSTAMPAAQAAAISAAITVIQSPEGEQIRQRLRARIAQFRELCRAAGIALHPSEHPIQTIWLGAEQLALAWGQRLADQQLDCGVIRPPTVPAGSARLRITITANHTEAAIVRLVEGLKQCLTN